MVGLVYFVLVYMISLYSYNFLFFFFKQKTAYEMRISDWSSDVCSSDLGRRAHGKLDYKDAARGMHDSGAQRATTMPPREHHAASFCRRPQSLAVQASTSG